MRAAPSTRSSVVHGIALALLLATAAASPAHAGGGKAFLALGSHVSLNHYSNDSSDGFTTITTGGGGGFLSSEPSLRLGFVEPSTKFETAIDVGFVSALSQGETLTDVVGLLTLSYYFDGSSSTSPFVTVQGGASSTDFGGSYSAARFGVGIGVRRKVAAEHGALKLELHAGLIDPERGESINKFGVRLGYDLWLRD